MRFVCPICCVGFIAILTAACMGPVAGSGDAERHERASTTRDSLASDAKRHYLREVVLAGHGDTFLIHWRKHKMPLQVYLPPPPPGLFEDPEAVKT